MNRRHQPTVASPVYFTVLVFAFIADAFAAASAAADAQPLSL
ncbi:MAG TPA: hypothetical protein VK530_17165 [Candidatus Acidoferrum sp.]|nr:hypothetical protein [Candidatus Acidoferrum sp.]